MQITIYLDSLAFQTSIKTQYILVIRIITSQRRGHKTTKCLQIEEKMESGRAFVYLLINESGPPRKEPCTYAILGENTWFLLYLDPERGLRVFLLHPNQFLDTMERVESW